MTLSLLLGPALAQEVRGPVEAFERVSDREGLVQAIDLAGDAVAFASPAGSSVELVVHNLTDGRERVVSTVQDPSGELRIESLAFDGRWVVWTDDRFGSLDVFVVDIQTAQLDRLTNHTGDETSVDASEGRAVWVQQASVHMVDLASGRTGLFQQGTGADPDPAIEGDRVAWSQAQGQQRLVQVRQEGVDDVLTVAEHERHPMLEPVLSGDLVLWRMLVLPPVGEEGRGPEGSRAQAAVVERVEVPNGTPTLERTRFSDLTPTTLLKDIRVGGDHIAWLRPGTDTERELLVQGYETGTSFTVPGPVSIGGLSDSHLVFVRADHDHGPIYAGPWADLSSAESGPAFAWPLAVAGLLLIVVGVAWKPLRRRLG